MSKGTNKTKETSKSSGKFDIPDHINKQIKENLDEAGQLIELTNPVDGSRVTNYRKMSVGSEMLNTAGVNNDQQPPVGSFLICSAKVSYSYKCITNFLSMRSKICNADLPQQKDL